MAETTVNDPFYTATASEADVDLFSVDKPVETGPKITADALMRSSIEEFKQNSSNWSNLNDCRESYAGAYDAYNKEKQAAKSWARRKASALKSFFLPKELDVDKVAEDESDAAKALKDNKSDYDHWKYQYADSLKYHLQEAGFSNEEIDIALKEEVIFDEYSRFRQERVKASVEDEKGLVKKALEWWRKSPALQRAAVSAVVGVGGFVAVSSGATLIGIAGVTITPAALIIRGGTRFMAAIASSFVGTQIGAHAVNKAVELFQKAEPIKEDILSSHDALREAAQKYETGAAKKDRTKRLITLGAAMVLGMGAGFGTSHVLADNLPHVVPTTPGGTGGTTSPDAGTSGKGSPPVESSTAKSSSSKVATQNYSNIKTIAKEFNLDATSPAAKKIAEYFDKHYASEEELLKLKALTAGGKTISVEEIDKTVLYNPTNTAELQNYIAEKQPKLFKTDLTINKDGDIVGGGAGKWYIDKDTGKLLYTGGTGNKGTVANIGWQNADDTWTEALPPSSRLPELDELKLIRQAYEQSGNPFTDGQKALIASQLTKGEVFSAADAQQVIDMKSAPAAPAPTPDAVAGGGEGTKITLDIGPRGPEGAMIDWLKKADPEEVKKIAKALGVADEKNYGAIAHRSWLESMEDPATRDALEKAGLSQYPDTMRGDLAGMRRITEDGKIVVDPATGKMSFEDTRFLKPRPISHTPIDGAGRPKPSAAAPSSSGYESSWRPKGLETIPEAETSRALGADVAGIKADAGAPSETGASAGVRTVDQMLNDRGISLDAYNRVKDYTISNLAVAEKNIVGVDNLSLKASYKKILDFIQLISGLSDDAFAKSPILSRTVKDYLESLAVEK